MGPDDVSGNIGAIDPVRFSQSVDRLEADGLVERYRDESGKPALRITEAGAALLARKDTARRLRLSGRTCKRCGQPMGVFEVDGAHRIACTECTGGWEA